MRGGKENHSTVSTVNTHISLTLSKSQRNKTKKVSKQNSINRKDKAQNQREMHKPRQSDSSSGGWAAAHSETEAVGTQVCTQRRGAARERRAGRGAILEASSDGEVTQDSRHTAGAPWANHELPRLVPRQQPTPPCWELPLLPRPLVVGEAP